MKTELRYSQLIFEALQETSREQHDALLQGFAELLRERGHLSMYPRIEKLLREKLLEAEGITVAEVTVSRKETFNKDLEKKVEKIAGGPVDVTVTVDPSIMGGFIIKTGDLLIDGSLKKRLGDLAATLQA